jgi:hypothetical protein
VSRGAFGGIIGVRFALGREAIDVYGNGVSVKFTATLTLNNDGECRFLVGREELNVWQVLRKGLEPLFFAPVE